MPQPLSVDQFEQQALVRQEIRPLRILFVAIMFAHLFITLMPFRLVDSWAIYAQQLHQAWTWVDSGLLLHAGLWFILGAMIGRAWPRQRNELSILYALAWLVPLLLVIELTQAATETRHASVIDWLVSCLAAPCGIYWACTRKWSYAQRYRLGQFIVKLARFIVITLSMFAAAVALQNHTATGFADWDKDFSLVLGNEADGSRPWAGSLRHVTLAPAADAPQGLIAHLLGPEPLQFSDKAVPYEIDQLRYQGTLHEIMDNQSMILQFIATTDDLAQGGPARLIAMSPGYDACNFVIAQKADALVFRLRTPTTGRYGYRRLEPHWDGVFVDHQPHHYQVTYSNGTMRLFVDGAQHGRPIYLFRMATRLGTDDPWMGFVIALLFFAPLGLLSALAWVDAVPTQAMATGIFLGVLPWAVVTRGCEMIYDRPIQWGLVVWVLTIWVAAALLGRWILGNYIQGPNHERNSRLS